MFFSISSDVFKVKTFWKQEVQLDCRQCFFITKGSLHLDIKFWTVEGSFTFCFKVVKFHVIHGWFQHALSIFPHFVIVKVFVSIFRVTVWQTETIVSQVEIFVNIDNQLKRTLELIFDLFRCYESMTIIKWHFTYTLKSCKGTRFFITVHHTNFSNTDRQFTVRVHMVFVNFDVVRTVHWTKDKGFTISHIHCWEHIFTVMIPVTWSFIKFNWGNWWSVDVLVACCYFLVHDVAFQDTTNCRTVW